MKTSPARLRAATALAMVLGAFDATAQDYLYVSNWAADSVVKLDMNGTLVATFANPALSGASGVALDSAGNLYVGSFGNNQIQRFSPAGEYLGVFATTGLAGPEGLVFDRQGNLFVANWNDASVMKFAPDGTSLGPGVAPGFLDRPAGLSLDANDNLYVASVGTGAVEKFAPDGTHLGAFVTGVSGPGQLVFDAQGRAYVAATGVNFDGTEVLRFTESGTPLGSPLADGLHGPFGMAVDSEGNLLVANFKPDVNTIQKFSPQGASLGTFASSGLNQPLYMMLQSQTNVPEPGTSTLLVLGGLFWLATGRWPQRS